MRNLEIEQSKLKCTDDELILQSDEKIDACQTFAQKTEDKNRRIYDSVLSYVEEQANINIRVGQLEMNFTDLMEAKPADINEVNSLKHKFLKVLFIMISVALTRVRKGPDRPGFGPGYEFENPGLRSGFKTLRKLDYK